MSNMKDYAMWLDDRGIATYDNIIGELIVPDSVDIYTAELLEEYHDDSKWHSPCGDPTIKTHDEPDDDELDEIEEEDDFLDDDELGDYIEWSPEENWYSPEEGLTDDAINMLYTQDSKGELV